MWFLCRRVRYAYRFFAKRSNAATGSGVHGVDLVEAISFHIAAKYIRCSRFVNDIFVLICFYDIITVIGGSLARQVKRSIMTNYAGGGFPPTLPGTDGPLAIDGLDKLGRRLEARPGLLGQVRLKFGVDVQNRLRFHGLLDGNIQGTPYIFWIFQVPFRGKKSTGREYGRVYIVIPKHRGTEWGRHIAVYSANTGPEVPAQVIDRLLAHLR
jgi:hypothetical protein